MTGSSGAVKCCICSSALGPAATALVRARTRVKPGSAVTVGSAATTRDTPGGIMVSACDLGSLSPELDASELMPLSRPLGLTWFRW